MKKGSSLKSVFFYSILLFLLATTSTIGILMTFRISVMNLGLALPSRWWWLNKNLRWGIKNSYHFRWVFLTLCATYTAWSSREQFRLWRQSKKDIYLWRLISAALALYLQCLIFYSWRQNPVFLFSFFSVIAFYFSLAPKLLFSKSLPLPSSSGKNVLKLEVVDGRLPLASPDSGILVVGAPGSGKTSIFKQLIRAFIKEGRHGVIYDYDYHESSVKEKNSLTSFAFAMREKYSSESDFFCINLKDPKLSARCNPFSSTRIKNRLYLSQQIKTLYSNLSFGQENAFFKNASTALLQAIFIFLSNHFPENCSLPHAIEFMGVAGKNLLQILESDKEAKRMVSSLTNAGGTDMLSSVVASTQIPLANLLSPELTFILSGDTITNKKTSIICLAGDVKFPEAIGPCVALLSNFFINERKNQDGTKKFFLLDEAPTLNIPKLPSIPATVRKYSMSTVIGLQSVSQLEAMYGRATAKVILDSCSSRFFGRAENETAKWVSEALGDKNYVQKVRHSNSSTSTSERTKRAFSAEDISSFQVGEFAGRVPSKNERGKFHTKMRLVEDFDYYQISPPPAVNHKVTPLESVKEVELDCKKMYDLLKPRLAAFEKEAKESTPKLLKIS